MSEDKEETSILEFQYSFGYDCQHKYNLCVCDENIIAWASGSILTFYNVIKKERYFHKSQTGGNIGHITKISSMYANNIAVGYGKSQGFSALIEIYDWPSMKSLYQLKNETENAYTHLSYSYDGKLLASLSGAPDYNITIWDWKNSSIRLKASAFSCDVYNVQFSPYVPNQLITCGSDHIKFWKMAQTHTGLKLKGTLGRFGNTDISDILGILPLPDEKILSGCSWGNILVWEQNEIKFEILRKGRQPCHSAPITQILYCAKSNEITTVGMDGHICTWYWKTVETLDIDEEEPYEEINPISETVLPNSQLISINHKRNKEWFVQDATGAIWEINLKFDEESSIAKEIQSDNAEKIIISHGGPVVGIAILRIGSFLISLGSDSSLILHKTPHGPMLTMGKYKSNASCIFHMPYKIDKYERTLVIGFHSGTIKIILLNMKNLIENESCVNFDECFILLQLLKPHTKLITTISVNENNYTLMTASEDNTIFVYRITNDDNIIRLSPLYFIETPNVVFSVDWKPSDNETVLLAGTMGIVLEAQLPSISDTPVIDDITSFKKYFISISKIEFENFCLQETNNILVNLSNGNEIPENDQLELVKLGKSTRKIQWAKYDPLDDSQVWAVQEFCNCIFRFKPSENQMNKYIILAGRPDISITSHLYIENGKYFITGYSNGEIAIFKMPTNGEDQSQTKFEDLLEKLKLNPRKKKRNEPETILVPKLFLAPLEQKIMHSSRVIKIILDAKMEYFYTAGADGNIFSFRLNFPMIEKPEISVTEKNFSSLNLPECLQMSIIDSDEILSHEEYVQEKEKNALKISISSHVQNVMSKLEFLRAETQEIIKLNSTLPDRQQICIKEHPFIQIDISSEINEKMKLVKRKLAYPLEVSSLHLKKMMQHNIEPLEIFPFQLNSILNENIYIKAIRQKKLPCNFFDNLEVINSHTLKKEEKESQEHVVKPCVSIQPKKQKQLDVNTKSALTPYSTSIMKNLPSSPPSHILTKALRSYLQRLERQRLQEIRWKEHLEKNTSIETEHRGSNKSNSTDEYCLKSQLNSIPRTSKYSTLLKMFFCRKEIYDIQHDFNNQIISLRKEKKQLIQKYNIFNNKMNHIATLLPMELIKSFPFPKPCINLDVEYPELKLLLNSSTNIEHEIDDHTENEYLLKIPRSLTNQTTSIDYRERLISILLMEQDHSILKMRTLINEWEKKFKTLRSSRERVILRAQFLRLHLLHLTQEQLILESFEVREKQLSQKVFETQQKIENSYQKLSIHEKELEKRTSSITTLLQKQKDLLIQLNKIISGSQYSSFLKQVFKRKLKSTGSAGSSLSSSSSTDDDESPSNNDHDVSSSQLDSNICPPGCDPQIFEETLNLRSIRCKLNDEIKEHKKHIDMTKKNLTDENNEIVELKKELDIRQNNLKVLVQEKQSQLNNIDTVVVLKSSQCRIDALEQLTPGGGALIFPANVIQDLKSKVQLLLKEAEEQKKLYDMSKTHLHRIQADCDFMKCHISELQNKIQRILQQKLGLAHNMSNLNYDNVKNEASKILDTVLENMINQFKIATTSGLTKDMQYQLNQWKKRQYDLEQQYCSAVQEYTTKLRTAAALQAELFSNKDSKKSDELLGTHLIDDYKKNIVRLKQIHKEKQKQIEELRAEVQRLKLKPYKSPILPPISPINMSTPPTIAATPPPSELPLDINTRSIAMSLAKELNDVKNNEKNSEHVDIENELMAVIGEVLPLLIEGQINVNEAANRIIGKFNSNRTEEQTESSRQTIAEILSQITNQNVKLGEFETVTEMSSYLKKNDPITEFINVIKGLINAGISPDNTAAIDAVILALIDITPQLNIENMDIENLAQQIHSTVLAKNDTQSDIESVKKLITTVINCMLDNTKDIAEMSSTAAGFLKQLQTDLCCAIGDSEKFLDSNQKKSDGEGNTFKKSQSSKHVSLCDLKLSPKSFNEPSTSNK